MANRLLILKVSKSITFEQNSKFLSLRKKKLVFLNVSGRKLGNILYVNNRRQFINSESSFGHEYKFTLHSRILQREFYCLLQYNRIVFQLPRSFLPVGSPLFLWRGLEGLNNQVQSYIRNWLRSLWALFQSSENHSKSHHLQMHLSVTWVCYKILLDWL